MARFRVRRRVHVRWTVETKRIFRTYPIIETRELEPESNAELERDTATETDPNLLTDEERRKK